MLTYAATETPTARMSSISSTPRRVRGMIWMTEVEAILI
jgi:hypothetical protein